MTSVYLSVTIFPSIYWLLYLFSINKPQLHLVQLSASLFLPSSLLDKGFYNLQDFQSRILDADPTGKILLPCSTSKEDLIEAAVILYYPVVTCSPWASKYAALYQFLF